jgi:hypothetical protein
MFYLIRIEKIVKPLFGNLSEIKKWLILAKK